MLILRHLESLVSLQKRRIILIIGSKVGNRTWLSSFFHSLQQGCLDLEQESEGTEKCGIRDFDGESEGISVGEASPGEFPWTCMILTAENGFVGNCAIIPGVKTASVITAAHKLNKISNPRCGEARIS